VATTKQVKRGQTRTPVDDSSIQDLVWRETPGRSQRLSCVLSDFRALSVTLLHVRRLSRLSATLEHLRLPSLLSCTFGDARALSVTLVRSPQLSCPLGDSLALSRRLSCDLGDFRALSVTLVRSR